MIKKENNLDSVIESFDLKGHVAIITGGGGLLGQKHAEAILECGGIPVLLDNDKDKVQDVAKSLESKFKHQCMSLCVDVTQPDQIEVTCQSLLSQFGRIDILINNATNNLRLEDITNQNFLRLEQLPIDLWNADLAVGLTGAFLCSRSFGAVMARAGKGAILNVSSDLGLIGPDQRLYKKN